MNGPRSSEAAATAAAAGEVVLDVDDPKRWPPAVQRLVDAWDRRVPAREFPSDLPMPDDAEVELSGTLDGHRLLTYHCTRLLDGEADDIRVQGLLPFTAGLFDARLDRAYEGGHLTAAQHRRLRDGHLAAQGELGAAEARRPRGRRDRVYLCAGASVLDDHDAVELLLTRWGGEGIARSAAGFGEDRALQRLGRPSVVVCAVTLSAADPPLCFPALPAVLLGAHRGDRVSTNVVLHRTVGPAEVQRITTPGDPVYDAHPVLPRA